MKFKNKNILVIGMGKTGIATAKFLLSRGSQVTIVDKKDKLSLEEQIKSLNNKNIKIIVGEYPEVGKDTYELIVVSPGVPLDIEPIVQATLNEIPVLSEIELSYQISDNEIIAVTGTNGKTTTTSLIGQIFSDAGESPIVAGNIGVPLVKEVYNSDLEKRIVVEVSSFQLETVYKFKPKVAVFLNITPDHLDRHKSFENYKKCKMNIFKNQSSSDYTILNYDDPIVKEMANLVNSQVVYFSLKNELDSGVYVKDSQIIANLKNRKDIICDVKHIKLKGSHNLSNVLAATSAALVSGISKESIANTLHTFSGVEHRLEPVSIIKDVLFVNDSKGTNPDASLKAIEAYSDKPIILIAGGFDKNSDFLNFAMEIKKKVKKIIVLGETAPKIISALENENFKEYYKVDTLKEAVEKSFELATAGDVVLLSPACASWDMFKSYEERGRVFKELVRSIGG